MRCPGNGLEEKGSVLVVDDKPQNLDLLSAILSEDGFEVRPAKSARMALASASSIVPDLILLDIVMPEMDGFELCRRLKEAESTAKIPVLFISAIDEGIDKLRAFEVGGVDFISKPFRAEEVIARVRTHMALRQSQLRLERQKTELEQQIAERKRTEEELYRYQEQMAGILEKKLRQPQVFREIVTRSEKMHSIFHYIEALSCSTEPVLVTGESGVGKELFARAIHEVCSSKGPWVPVNIAGLDDNVFADTLFGHLKGAFTGADRARAGMVEKAAGGTLFLDEIGDLSPLSQVKLLRLLQEKEFIPLGSDQPQANRARVVVATNVDLEEKQAGGTFRKDLFFRLYTHHIEIPPLRERREDIPLLLDHFLEQAAREMGKKRPTPPEELYLLLENYPFPGNVRELRAMVFNAVSVHRGRKLSMELFEKAMGIAKVRGKSEDQRSLVTFHSRLPTLKEVSDLLVQEALQRTRGNQTMAAKLLGITQPALSSRLKKITESTR